MVSTKFPSNNINIYHVSTSDFFQAPCPLCSLAMAVAGYRDGDDGAATRDGNQVVTKW